MRVKYLGPNRRIRASAISDWVGRGGEIELTDAQITALRRDGHRFEPADSRQNLPEPEPEPEPEVAEPDEP